MIEYSTVTFAILGGFVLLGWPFLSQLLDAFNTFYESIYYVIQSPIP